jgi:hypothetical protein
MPTKIPDWAKFALVLAGTLVTLVLSWSDVKADLRVEVSERQAQSQSLKESDTRQEQILSEIKVMLREEMERHHPRK